MINPCIIIPVYNHPEGIRNTVEKMLAYDLPFIIVDDGSDATCAEVVTTLAHQHTDVTAIHHATNRGKGAAVKSALRQADQLGYSHALQIDADEQHDSTACADMFNHARQYPQAVILGTPIYDKTIPRARLFGRYLTHVLVWINTWSMQIRDAMCGCRIYPVATTLALVDTIPTPERMAFDTEILVRLAWLGASFINTPVKVSYPENGISHFRYLRDNWHISGMHTRLFFGMLKRSPKLLARKFTHA